MAVEDQKIVKNRRPVLFTLADGREISGEVFLSLYEVSHQGPQRVGELLNGEGGFIPVETTGGMVNLNIANIISATTPKDQEADGLMRLGEKYRVEITTLAGKTIEGEVYVNLPHHCQRVSDYLNSSQKFCRVFQDKKIVYIGTRFILLVRD